MQEVENSIAVPERPAGWTNEEWQQYRLHRRFDRIARLLGDRAMLKLWNAHVYVIGLGGVGSWAAEMLVRSGVGTLTLIDFDDICVTNINRQIHAQQNLIGQPKVSVMEERLKKINPQVTIHARKEFYNQDTHADIFATIPDFVVDAIDSITPKCQLLNFCVKDNVRVVTSTGSGGRVDSTQVRIEDLGLTELDPMARAVRKILRSQYDFPPGKFNLPAVVSLEPAEMPVELKYDNGKGFKCVCPGGENPFFNCDNRNLIMGNAGFVTGAFGMALSSYVVRALTQELPA